MVTIGPVSASPVYTAAPPAMAAQVSPSRAEGQPILDPIDLSAFAKEDRNTDAGKVRDPDKKSFKNIREYIQYMLLMYDKLHDLKARPGEIHVKMEDKAELAEVHDAMDGAELV